MTDASLVLTDLRAWSARQPDGIRARADIIGHNLRGLIDTPNDKALLRQTAKNVDDLEKQLMVRGG